ncbi:glycoside hydrolase family 3 protein [Desulfococcus sp.]|uniref:glycoside hydrolase family 3 protein n=1 Tax=Desulfococcus sp. TaxID=2025834 RepID=UPI0035930A30
MTVNGYSPEQMAGQRLMAGFDGTDFDGDLAFLIEDLKVGGIILFSRNIGTPQQVADLCRSAQECAAGCGQPGLFIAVDQEGGPVARLKRPFTEFPGNPAMTGEADADRFAAVTASELTQVGINMNMAPVLDVAPEGFGSIMETRAFGHDPEWVSRMGCRVIRGLQAGGVMAVAKHFPGIGRTTLDSHLDLPVVDLGMADLEALELPPFAAAFNEGVSGVMLSHILYRGIDPVWPASLSVRIARDLLRGRMGFEGLVLTDDLDMGAVGNHYGIDDMIRRIVAAEIDIVLICHKGPNIARAYDRLLAETQADGRASIASFHRIMQKKQAL